MATNFFDPTYMDSVFSALLVKLQAEVNGHFPVGSGLEIKQFARTYRAPDTVTPADQPSLFMVPGPSYVDQKEFALAKWVFTTILLIYLRADGNVTDPDPLVWTQANYVIWAIMNTLSAGPALTPYEKQTLGGLVTHCWIEGEVAVETESEQAVIAVPIYILAGNID